MIDPGRHGVIVALAIACAATIWAAWPAPSRSMSHEPQVPLTESSPSRRTPQPWPDITPRVDAPQVVPAVQEPPPPLTLMSILSQEGFREALLSQADGSIQRLRVGSEVEGWTLVAIETDGVVFRRGERDVRLVLP